MVTGGRRAVRIGLNWRMGRGHLFAESTRSWRKCACYRLFCAAETARHRGL